MSETEEINYRGIVYKISLDRNLAYFDIILNRKIIEFLGGEHIFAIKNHHSKTLYKSCEYSGLHYITCENYNECHKNCREIIDTIISFYSIDSKRYEEAENEFKQIE